MAFILVKAYEKLICLQAYSSKDICQLNCAAIHWHQCDARAFTLSQSLSTTKIPPAFCFHRKRQISDRNTQRNYFPNEVCRIYHGRACSCMCSLWEGEKSTKWQLHGWWSLIFSGMFVQDGWVVSTSSAICHTVPQLMSKPKKCLCKISYSSFKA